MQGPSGIHSTPQAGANTARMPSRLGDERTEGENLTAYETLLVQLIQNVGLKSTGRMMVSLFSGDRLSFPLADQLCRHDRKQWNHGIS